MGKIANFRRMSYPQILWALVGGSLIAVSYYQFNRGFNQDEFEAIHSSWKMLNEQRIWIDFFQHHHPLMYYALFPVIAFFGENSETVIVIRAIIFLLFLLIIFTAYKISLEIYKNREIALISLVLLLTTISFLTGVTEIRPDTPQTLFALISIFLLFRFYESQCLKSLVVSALCLGVSFLFLQKTIFLIAAIGGIFLVDIYQNKISAQKFLIYVFSFILSIIPFYLYLAWKGNLSLYFFFNWKFNLLFLDQFSPYHLLKSTYRQNTIYWVFYLLGILFLLKTRQQKRLGFLSLALLLSIFFVQVPRKQYLMTAFPLIAIISAGGVHWILKENKKMLIVVYY